MKIIVIQCRGNWCTTAECEHSWRRGRWTATKKCRFIAVHWKKQKCISHINNQKKRSIHNNTFEYFFYCLTSAALFTVPLEIFLNRQVALRLYFGFLPGESEKDSRILIGNCCCFFTPHTTWTVLRSMSCLNFNGSSLSVWFSAGDSLFRSHRLAKVSYNVKTKRKKEREKERGLGECASQWVFQRTKYLTTRTPGQVELFSTLKIFQILEEPVEREWEYSSGDANLSASPRKLILMLHSN